MLGIRPPIKPVTPAEYKVIFVGLGSLLIIIGLISVVMGFLAPPDKQEVAKIAIHTGFGAIVIGLLFFGTLWLISRWTDL